MIGTMRLAGVFDGLKVRPRSRHNVQRFLSRAIDFGFRSFDTAPIYCRGIAEEALGDFSSEDLAITTKVGVNIDSTLPQLAYSYSEYWRSLEGSLTRLRRSRVSCLLLHNPAVRQVRSDDFLRFCEDVLRQGISHRVGCSVSDSVTFRAAVELSPNSDIMISRQLLNSPSVLNRSRKAGQRILVRTLFGGTFANTPARIQPSQIVNEAISTLRGALPLAQLVIAPHTLIQLTAYKDDINSASQGGMAGL
ncbi:aldo/keto reductase [Pelomonas sp. Root1237]|uniref:aldo/keto reductase n=1 Tax=Pelomonas sp. Root1237 TaxID=1736434 RepID=UPI00373FD2D9